MRRDREDYTGQREALNSALSDLEAILLDLADDCRTAAKGCLRRQRASKAARGAAIDLDAVYAGVQAVRRGEEAVDLAMLDLQTAQGEDA